MTLTLAPSRGSSRTPSRTPTRTLVPLAPLLLAVHLVGCTSFQQLADLDYEPPVADPAFSAAEGPVVLIDEAHHNYHTAEGRYGPFRQLLERDGYTVRPLRARASQESLADADVLVIANSLAAANLKKWKLPTPSAFGDDEVAAIVAWVEAGGSLLLIADHMPFPGATADLAKAFDIFFANGFAMPTDRETRGKIVFSTADGSMADHPIVRGRGDSEHVDAVVSFTGQAFRATGEVSPLLVVPGETELLLPVKAWKFSDETPRLSAEGLLQGAVLRHGEGRVAVFGEAAMFTAQVTLRDGEKVASMGMNSEGAEQNAQFALNVMHWLSGLLP